MITLISCTGRPPSGRHTVGIDPAVDAIGVVTHRPNPSQVRVERCSEWSSERAGNGISPAACCWWVRIDAGHRRRTGQRERMSQARGRSRSRRGAWRDRSRLPSCAAPVARRPRRAGSTSARRRRRAAGTRAPLRGGARASVKRAGGLRRIVLVADARAARGGQPVAGDFARTCGPVDVDHDQLLPSILAHTRSSTSSCGTE